MSGGTSRKVAARVRWEQQGTLLLMSADGWKRAVIMPEGRGYIGVGIFGCGLQEWHDTNRRALKQRLADQYRREFAIESPVAAGATPNEVFNESQLHALTALKAVLRAHPTK